MEKFLTTVEKVNGVVNNFVWGPVMLVIFLFVGFMFTIRSGVFQITKFKLWINTTFLACFRNKKVLKTEDDKAISQFQSLCTALAATIGTGNIAGVATAIVSGGPGAIFWMWLSAFLGMMTNFAENVLGIKYRYKNEKGHWIGGAMIYIEKGLHCKWLAIIFSCFCVLASFGIGNIAQANSIASGLKGAFHIPTIATGVIIAVIVALVIVGGIKRIASITEKIVPFMASIYLLGALIVIFFHITEVPKAFVLIFKEAFQLKAAGGGILGYGIMLAMRQGIARGVFSNEAGLGSSVMVHSASDVKEPVIQGMWGIFEVCADTLIVCTITALTILTSGVYQMESYLANIKAGIPVISGVELTSSAFSTVFGTYGGAFVSIALVLFAFSTLLGWSYYGERGVEYLFGLKAVPIYKCLFILVVVAGCTASLDLVWDLSDTFNGLMAMPNLIAITLLSGKVIEELKDYLKRAKKGEIRN